MVKIFSSHLILCIFGLHWCIAPSFAIESSYLGRIVGAILGFSLHRSMEWVPGAKVWNFVSQPLNLTGTYSESIAWTYQIYGQNTSSQMGSQPFLTQNVLDSLLNLLGGILLPLNIISAVKVLYDPSRPQDEAAEDCMNAF